jgi:hypothetical protein
MDQSAAPVPMVKKYAGVRSNASRTPATNATPAFVNLIWPHFDHLNWPHLKASKKFFPYSFWKGELERSPAPPLGGAFRA